MACMERETGVDGMVTASSAPRGQHAHPHGQGKRCAFLSTAVWMTPPGLTQGVVFLFYRRQVVHREICTKAEIHSKLEQIERTSCVVTTFRKVVFFTQFVRILLSFTSPPPVIFAKP